MSDDDLPITGAKPGRRPLKPVVPPSPDEAPLSPTEDSPPPLDMPSEDLKSGTGSKNIPETISEEAMGIDQPLSQPPTDDCSSDDEAPLLGGDEEDEDLSRSGRFSDEDLASPSFASSGSRRRKRRRRDSSASEVETSDAEDEDAPAGQVVSTSRDRDRRTKLVAQILARWWHVLPPWPPEDFDYDAELSKRKLKRVSFDDWEVEDDVDVNQLTKVYEITHYPGVFRDPTGAVIDLRPETGKPCFKTLSTHTDIELYQMLITALKNQLRELDNSPYLLTDALVVQRLREDLNRESRLAMQTLTRLEKGA